ncbi:MAG: hypothetical protein KJO24_04810 [Gammaproteobacteria bacterium]|nr:hypothetical protein [Gammaproteobacteria bacterium]
MQTLDNSKHTGTAGEKRCRSFRFLIFRNLTITGLALALAAAFIYSIITIQFVKNFYEHEGLQASENFAQLSELALLYDSGENGREAAIATLNFPSIKHVAIINAENSIIFDEGATNEGIIDKLKEVEWRDEKAKIISKNPTTWHVAAPVFTVYEDESSDELISDDEPSTRNYLGYVAVQVDASQVKAVQFDIFVRNLVIGLAYGLAFLIVIGIALRGLLTPLSRLAENMEESTDGAYKHADLDPSASLEIKTITQVYNQMISALSERDMRLRGQKDLLETEVAIRTSELIQARDAALEANRHKSEFLANITHELRTPLQSILGYAEILQETLADDGLVEFDNDLEKISRNANHLLHLINSILDISKIEAGKMDVITQQCDINELINSAAETIKPLVEKNNNRLEIDVDCVGQRPFIDAQKLFQILLNLLSNAAKFTESGIINISASVNDSMLCLSVADTGIGMSEEQQRLVFEPFRQLDAGDNRRFVGTGLGLSIVLRLTEILGGELRVESALNQGSRFIIHLPVELEARRYQGEI